MNVPGIPAAPQLVSREPLEPLEPLAPGLGRQRRGFWWIIGESIGKKPWFLLTEIGYDVIKRRWIGLARYIYIYIMV